MTRTMKMVCLALAAAIVSCGGDGRDEVSGISEGEQRFPDVIAVDVSPGGDGTYRFDVTISSPYDTSERYADAWRIKDNEGSVYGVRELFHDHASEQPFTRSLTGVEIPGDIERVIVEGRDLVNGWGGETMEVPLS